MQRAMTTTKTKRAAPRPQRSVWSEYTPYAALREPGLLGELARRNIQLAVAVTPPLVGELGAVLGACRAAGVPVAIWPMLSDAEGRWASAANAESYCRFVGGLLDSLSAQGALPEALAIDLEPPIARVRQLTSWGNFSRLQGFRSGTHDRHAAPAASGSEDAAAARLAALTADAAARGLSILAAVVPPIVIGPDAVAQGWQRLLQTPIDALPIDRVSAMAYTSLLQGYSRGILRRADARALLWKIARATHDRYGSRASVSLGAVGIGALGDEQTYRRPEELIDDVSLARAAGIDDLALFNLDGALARPPLGAWLDALVTTGPSTAPPPATLRANLIRHGLRMVGYLGYL